MWRWIAWKRGILSIYSSIHFLTEKNSVMRFSFRFVLPLSSPNRVQLQSSAISRLRVTQHAISPHSLGQQQLSSNYRTISRTNASRVQIKCLVHNAGVNVLKVRFRKFVSKSFQFWKKMCSNNVLAIIQRTTLRKLLCFHRIVYLWKTIRVTILEFLESQMFSRQMQL